jgi:dihydropteroate synthase
MTPARQAAISGQPSAKPSAFDALVKSSSVAVMGVLNVTPDSFSDGGHFLDAEPALAHARAMIAAGAAIIDIGAESTRPYGGMKPVSAEDEIARLRPIVAKVVSLGTPVSVDTMKADVARFALAGGATMINDVWGLQRDPAMAEIIAHYNVPVVIMHNRTEADPAIDIMVDIAAFFDRSLAIAASAGIARDHILLDPGIGFGKTAEQSMTALARLGELKAFGCPILVGASRKRFITSVVPSEPDQRLGGSIAAHLVAVRNGARIIRAHDVAETVQALAIMAAIESKQ